MVKMGAIFFSPLLQLFTGTTVPKWMMFSEVVKGEIDGQDAGFLGSFATWQVTATYLANG